ncbi:MAG TPA: hypothetical protein VFQ53_32960 [Kofleriaceae bacterium]|nr:hypothetical protein [Kofleriaceae bacterium]
MLRVCLVMLVILEAGCESCEWSNGSLQVGGRVIVKGTPPYDLEIHTCKTPQGDECNAPATVRDDGDGPHYLTGIPSTGLFTCDYDQRWLRATATGCTPTVIELLSTEAMGDDRQGYPAVADLDAVDVTIYCGVSRDQ